jgi:hypothetical protein
MTDSEIDANPKMEQVRKGAEASLARQALERSMAEQESMNDAMASQREEMHQVLTLNPRRYTVWSSNLRQEIVRMRPGKLSCLEFYNPACGKNCMG